MRVHDRRMGQALKRAAIGRGVPARAASAANTRPMTLARGIGYAVQPISGARDGSMKALMMAALMAALPVPDGIVGLTPSVIKPPQPYADQTVLPGKIPATARSLSGAWHYGYLLRRTKLENGANDLMVTVLLTLNEDHTYEMIYSAHWDLPSVLSLPVPVPGATSQPHLIKGRTVKESGRFSLSGEILLLEPASTEFSEVQSSNGGTHRQSIPDENHVWIVRLDTRGTPRLSIAGRCASYQLDPVCSRAPVVWYSMQSRPRPLQPPVVGSSKRGAR